MIPSLASPDRLFQLAPALHARLERVSGQRQDLENITSDSQDSVKEKLAKLKSEELMLQQITDWIQNCDNRNKGSVR